MTAHLSNADARGEVARLLVGRSHVMQRLRAMIARVAPTKLPVLVTGPSGAGKELVARALHAASGRTGGFVASNVCAIPDGMFEDILFGHVRGAFTGAINPSLGLLAEAHAGTLFLDEIGGLAPASQMKLLRALETGEFRPVGGRADQRSDFRIVAATNESLPDLVLAGRFRADLAHRLNGIVLEVPPLRSRLDDVPDLVEHLLRTTHLGVARLSDAAIEELQGHHWPGNVRELRHVVERAWALCDGPTITDGDVRRALAMTVVPVEGGACDAERDELLRLLRACKDNVQCVAEQLGLDRSTVYRRMRKLGIPVTRGRGVSTGFVPSRSQPRASGPGFVFLGSDAI